MTDVSTSCAEVIFRVKVICNTSVDDILNFGCLQLLVSQLVVKS